jgi:hypothetical protein
MANTAAYYQSQLTAIDAMIDAMIASPRPNYRVGDTQMAMGDLLKNLYEIRGKILTYLSQMQGETIDNVNTDMNVFGQDMADYINEPNQ